MFEIKELTKIYYSNKKKVTALDSVSFSLPNKGMVFITGRSGSGKSTLLNLIGGLDKPSKGEIIFNNIDVTSLSEKETSKYRNDFIGFVFQDFALIEGMSVEDNILLSLELKREEDKGKIDLILNELGILHLKKRKVTELSAGEKQRVAIARASIKKPKVILADEPTGNLDHDTGQEVLKFFKKLSKDSLVVIISHNKSDAFKYADRIISISKGKIVSDLKSDASNRVFTQSGNTLYLNDVKEISKEDILKINEDILNKKIEYIKPINELFFNTKDEKVDSNLEVFHFSKSSLDNKGIHKLFSNLLGKFTLKSMIFSAASMLLISLFSLCMMLINFDSREIYNSVNTPTISLIKEYLDENEEYKDSIIGKITEEDKKQIETSSDYYYFYNAPIFANSLYYRGREYNMRYVLEYVYTRYSFGTAGVNEDQFKKIFDVEEIEYLAKAEVYEESGVYLTDYLADSYLYRGGLTIIRIY